MKKWKVKFKEDLQWPKSQPWQAKKVPVSKTKILRITAMVEISSKPQQAKKFFSVVLKTLLNHIIGIFTQTKSKSCSKKI